MSIKAYKGFNKDMTCNGFQYEEGKEYQAEGKIELCKNGFHACEDPLDCFRYYSPATSVFHEVEQDGEIYNNRNGDDSKTVSSQIKIGANIGITEIVKAHCDYVKAHITTEHTNPKKATAGDYGAATAGFKGAATAGDFGAATAGSYGIASSFGSASVGIKALAVCRSDHPKARGKLGAILVVAVENQNKEIVDCKMGTVDNEQLMEDRWYTVKNGAWVEAEVD